MGEVAAKIKVMPADVETDLEALKKKLAAAVPEGSELYGEIQEEPIAFGLKALIVTVIVGDQEGGTEAVEEAFAKVEGAESIQILELGRL
ncbi:MAG: elongation factor 1-beta [Methanosarcinaceae archaeon]|nr:elongation factor 1-beta [Methanosarcinaceae archaeon]MDD4331566.1 elongation factor 1-beta [Methanosarcinaceae archaeon]MDD4749772.1 elongation factor 1-beta [Methanosarcinaceae archaeon]